MGRKFSSIQYLKRFPKWPHFDSKKLSPSPTSAPTGTTVERASEWHYYSKFSFANNSPDCIVFQYFFFSCVEHSWIQSSIDRQASFWSEMRPARYVQWGDLKGKSVIIMKLCNGSVSFSKDSEAIIGKLANLSNRLGCFVLGGQLVKYLLYH